MLKGMMTCVFISSIVSVGHAKKCSIHSTSVNDVDENHSFNYELSVLNSNKTLVYVYNSEGLIAKGKQLLNFDFTLYDEHGELLESVKKHFFATLIEAGYKHLYKHGNITIMTSSTEFPAAIAVVHEVSGNKYYTYAYCE